MTRQNRSNRPQLCFTAGRFSDAGSPYEHFEIRVFYENFLFTNETTVVIAWQTDREFNKWYGSDIRLNVGNSAMLEKAYKLAQRVVRGLEGSDITPEQVLDRLAALKATEVVYDPRLGEAIPLDKVAGPEIKRWMDNWRALGRANCRHAVQAETEEQARKLIIKEAADNNDTRFISQFIDAGMPVFTNGDRRPDTTPARERMKIQTSA